MGSTEIFFGFSKDREPFKKGMVDGSLFLNHGVQVLALQIICVQVVLDFSSEKRTTRLGYENRAELDTPVKGCHYGHFLETTPPHSEIFGGHHPTLTPTPTIT